jgi:hypothetical protein
MTFAAVEAGGISAVAETLGSSPPAVSRRVKALERALALGLPIAAAAFPSDRRGRSITNIVSPFSKTCGTPKPKCDCKRFAPTLDRKPARLDALPPWGSSWSSTWTKSSTSIAAERRHPTGTSPRSSSVREQLAQRRPP